MKKYYKRKYPINIMLKYAIEFEKKKKNWHGLVKEIIISINNIMWEEVTYYVRRS